MPTEVITYSQSIMSAPLIGVNRVQPIYWCAIPPTGAFALPQLDVKLMTHEGDSIPFQRAGWYEVAGYIISNTSPLTANLSMATPQQLVDDWIHKIAAPDFDNGEGISNDERFASVGETTGAENDGGDFGQENVQSTNLLSHPAVYDQAQELGLGATQVYYYSSGLGVPYGKAIPVDEQRVVYSDEFTVSLDMMRAGGHYNMFILVASIPELGASKTGSHDEEQEPIAPWNTWEDMIQMFAKAPLEWVESMDEGSLGIPDDMQRTPSANAPTTQALFRELIEWKRLYNVPVDTWHNSVMRSWIRGSAVLTMPFYLYKRHI